MRPTHLTLTVLLLTAALAGCGDPDPVATTTAPPTGGTPSAGSAAPTGSAASTGATPSAASPTGSLTASATPRVTASAAATVPTSTPGGSFDVRPRDGDVLAVFGVAHDDTLALRSGPGRAFPVAAAVPNLADDVTATGRGWQGDGGIWVEVRRRGVTGWANSRYLHWVGPTEDLTARVVEVIGARPTAPTPAELGRRVAEALAGDEEATVIVQSVPPSGTDPAEVTYDLLGIGDDAVSGWRLHVFTTPDGGTHGLRSVEATAFCSRGGSPTSPCV